MDKIKNVIKTAKKGFGSLSHRSYNIKICFILFVISLIINWYVGSKMRLTDIQSDEIGTLASAAYVAGDDWSGVMRSSGYHGYGSSLLYIPLYILIDDGVLIYRLITLINCVLVSIIPVITYLIVNKYLGTNRIFAFLISLLCGLMPGNILFTKLAWAEAMFCLLPWLILYVLLLADNSNRQSIKICCGIILSALSVYSYAVHGRGLFVIATVIILLLCMCIFNKKIRISALAYLISFATFYLLYNSYKLFLINNVWNTTSQVSLVNTFAFVSNRAVFFIYGGDLSALFMYFIGHVVAADVATYGTLLIFLVLISPCIFKVRKMYELSKRKVESNTWIVYGYSSMLLLLSLLTSVIFLSIGGGNRADVLIYLRYIFVSFPFVIMTCIHYLISNRMSKSQLLIIGFLLFAGIILSRNVIEIINNRKVIYPISYINIYTLIDNETAGSHIDFLNFAMLLILFTLFNFCMTALNNKSKKYYVACLICLSIYIVCHTQNRITESSAKRYLDLKPYIDIIQSVDNLSENYPYIYFYANQDYVNYPKHLQVALHRFHIGEVLYRDTLDLDEVNFNNLSENSIIISFEDFDFGTLSDNLYRIKDKFYPENDYYIWVYGDDEFNYILDHNYNFSISKY